MPKSLINKRVWFFNGQRLGRAYGSAAEFIALDKNFVTPLADDISFEEGATLGIPAMTAYHSVFSDGPVSGKTILVTGGSGAVGFYAVSLASWGGAKPVVAAIIAAIEPQPVELLRRAFGEQECNAVLASISLLFPVASSIFLMFC